MLNRTTLLTTMLTTLSSLGQIALGQGPETPVPLLATATEVNRITPTQTTGQVSFTVDDVETILVDIISTSPDLTTSIQEPGGVIIDAANAETLGGEFIQIEGAETGPLLLIFSTPGTHYRYTLPSFGPGNYTVAFAAPSTITEDIAVLTQILTDSQCRTAMIALPDTVTLGNAVVLSVPVFDGTDPVLGADIAAMITTEDSAGMVTTESLILKDDGDMADEEGDDGLYTGIFMPPAIGSYVTKATINGTTMLGMPFMRTTGANFRVVSQSSRLNGAPSDQGIDEDHDGKLEGIAITVPIEITEEGSHQAFVLLTTGNGQQMRTSIQETLAIGSHTLQARIPSETLQSLGEDGPYAYTMVETLFQSGDDSITTDQAFDQGFTQAYQITQLQQPAIALGGGTTDEGIDDDADGLFDRLQVGIDITRQNPSTCNWTVKLTDETQQEIDFANGSGNLTGGNNTIMVDFNGQTIGNTGIDGPYLIRDLLMECTQDSLVALTVGKTQPFESTQFEKSLTITIVRPMEVEPGQQITITGTGFANGPIQVTLNGFVVSATVVNDTTIVITIPGFLPAGLITIVIATPTGSITLSEAFTVAEIVNIPLLNRWGALLLLCLISAAGLIRFWKQG